MTDAIRSRAARGFLFALAAGLAFQCLNVTVKALVLDLPPMQAAWMRWLTGIVCIPRAASVFRLPRVWTQ